MKKRAPSYFRKAARGIPGGAPAPQADLLPPPYLPDVRNFGGIGRWAVVPPGRGITVQIEAFSLYEGDQISVFWDDAIVPVATASVPPGQNGPLDIFVLASKIPFDPIAPPPPPTNSSVWHTIYRPVSGETFTSEAVSVVVDFQVPGDPDPDQSTPSINENLLPIVGLDGAITPGQPLLIYVPRWKYCSVDDRLIVSWGRENLPGLVIADALGQTGPDIPVTVPWEIIESVNGGVAMVTYHVVDKVTNHSLFAAAVEVDASAGGRRDAPEVLDTDDFGKLPIEALNLGPVHVQVQYKAPAPAFRDEVVLTFGGLNREGIALEDATYLFSWPESLPIRHTFKVPYEKALALVGGEIRTSYTVQPLGAPKPSYSAIAVVGVIGTAANLPPPEVPDAVGGQLDPAMPARYVTVLVRADYPFFQPDDRITLYWRGESLDHSVIVTDQQTLNGSDAVNDQLTFHILKDKVVQVAGGTVTVSYEVRTPGNVIVPSDPLPLTVKSGGGSIVLPQAIVEGASPDNTLDPGDVGDAIVVHVPPNPAFLPGDKLQVVWQGVGLGGSFTTPEQAANIAGVRFEVDKSVLPPNAGQRVTVYYLLVRPGVEPNQDSDKRYITVLEDSSEGDLPVPTVTEASGTTLDPFAAAKGATVVVPARADLIVTDTVTATFKGATGGHAYTTPSTPAQPGMRFTIPPADIAKLLGTRVTVFYTRTRAGKLLDSETLTLDVGDFQADDPRVTPAVFTDAKGTFVLDLNTFTGDANVSVEAWPLMAADQRFWLRAIGGDNTWPPIVDGETVTTVGDLTRTLARALLTTLADNTSISLQLTIAFGGGAEATGKVFRSPEYTVRAKLPLELRRPVPDFVEAGYIDVGKIPASGLRVVVEKYQGMEPGQTIALSCVSAIGTEEPTPKKVTVLQDYSFVVPKAYFDQLVSQAETPMAGFGYLVTPPGGIDGTSPFYEVTFYRSSRS